jgi:hypothetical protein
MVYQGVPFWSKHSFQRNILQKVANARMLIGGSGDGALQDYLQAITDRDDIKTLYRECNIPKSIIDVVQSAEDRAHRGRSWVNTDVAFRAVHEERCTKLVILQSYRVFINVSSIGCLACKA